MHLYPSAIFLLLCQDYPSFGAGEYLLFCVCSRIRNRCYKNTNHQYHSACDDLFSSLACLVCRRPEILAFFLWRGLYFFNTCISSSWWKQFRIINLLGFMAKHQHTQQKKNCWLFSLDQGQVVSAAPVNQNHLKRWQVCDWANQGQVLLMAWAGVLGNRLKQ